jgi:rod shape-determining protein MreC
MESFFARHKNATILAVVLGLQVLGLATQIKRPTESGPVRLIRYWAVSLITPFGRGFVHTEEWIRGGWRDYFYLRGVRQENAELRQQIERMRLEQVRLEQDAAQARRLQVLLQFKEQYIAKTVAAQVIGSSGSETSHLIYIDRGSRDGIQPNMAVITPAGIVGKVLRVYATTAQVLEITDQTSGVGSTLVKSRLQGILKGQPSGDPRLAYIMSDEAIAAGEEVITSGGDRIFPKGLPIGKVVSASPGKDLFLNVRVSPSANLARLEEVLVITKVEEREPNPQELGPIRAADILAQRLPSVPDKNAEAASPGAASGSVTAGTVRPTASTQTAAPDLPAAPKPGTVGATKPGATTPAAPGASATAPSTKPKAAAKAAESNGELEPSDAGTTDKPKAAKPAPAANGAKPAANGDDSAAKPHAASSPPDSPAASDSRSSATAANDNP